MKVLMRVLGLDTLMAKLRYVATTVPENGRKTMHRAADRIVREAKLNTPVDTHNLEATIRKEVEYGFRGRLKINIVMGGVVNGVNVDQYATIIHERYEQVISVNGPGEGTLAKRAANPGRYIGEKFLERALEDNRERLEESIFQAVIGSFKL